jgi:hypothetical protein
LPTSRSTGKWTRGHAQNDETGNEATGNNVHGGQLHIPSPVLNANRLHHEDVTDTKASSVALGWRCVRKAKKGRPRGDEIFLLVAESPIDAFDLAGLPSSVDPARLGPLAESCIGAPASGNVVK